MTEQQPHQNLASLLSKINGWWRIWILVFCIALFWGTKDGANDRTKFRFGNVQLSDVYCLPGSVEEGLDFEDRSSEIFGGVTAMQAEPITVSSCVLVRDFFRQVWTRIWPVLLLPLLVFLGLWVLKGFKKELDANG